jgi:hypothetical protein
MNTQEALATLRRHESVLRARGTAYALRDILRNINLSERSVEGQTFEIFQSDELPG